MKDENKTKAELIKELKTLKKEREKGVFKDIGEHEKVDKGLKESEEKCLRLFENMMDGLVLHRLITDKNGHPVDYILEKANKAAEKILSWNRKDIEGKKATEVYSGDTPFIERYAKVAQTGKAKYFVDYYPRFKKWYEINSFCPEKGYFANIFRDITERKQAKQVIQESEFRFRELFDNISSGVAIYEAKNNGRDFIIKDFNRAAEKIDKVNKEDIIGKSVLKVFPGVKDFGLFKVFQEVYKTGKPQHHPISLYKDQRITGWIENHVYKLPSGEIVAVHDDITERKQAEKQIRDSEERFEILFDYAPDAYYISDLKGKFIDGNKAAERLMGYKKEDLIRSSFLKLKLLSITDIAKAAKLLAKNRRGQPTGPDEFILNRKDNSKVTVEISTYPVKIKGRTLVLGIARDITERKRAESELQIERDKLTTIFESMADGVYIVNKDHDIQYVNPVLKKTFGSPEGKKCHEYFHDSDEPCTFCRNEDVFAGKTVRWEWTSLKYGKTYDLIDTPIKNADGSISKLEIFRDITESKQAEERLKKTMNATIQTVSKIIEAKDPYISGHQQRVSQLATAMAKELNLSQDKVEGIRVASLIHDIGKIGLPTEILSKPTKLTDTEFNLIKEHSQKGYDILKSIDFAYPVDQIVLQHHEKINGTGYPNKIKGDKILLEAKIIGVADVVEAMSSHRPYRPALGIDRALEEILKNKGILYDPGVVDACLKLFKEKGFKL
jgi:PAS domain S-box-containing protein/putative nucleotidyltransferase with HDIG domain